ncbi:MAG: NAD(P)-dependent oxidoreductase [Chloroflexota bacterium]
MRPISGSGTPARARATGSDAVKPWNPAWTAKRATARRITPPSSATCPTHARRSRPVPSCPMERVAFLGLGTMGAAMAANLARAGFAVTAWNRTPGRASGLAELGVTVAATPAQAVADAALVVVCVSDTPDVEAVLFGPDGVVDGARPGTLIIDCSTIAPSGSWDFAARLHERELAMVDAPVSGGSEGARNATLTIFVGGDARDVERARPVLAAMGRTITHVGPIGAGQAVKAVNQVILAGTYLGVAEGIVLALKAGLDVEQVADALGGGAAQSWVLANRSGRMLDNDYPLGFKVTLHRKDLAIALDLANQLGAALPVTALAAQLETGLIARGHGDDDVSALARAIRGLSGLDD